ncbi:hypothetical protein [Sporosarcina saromensis]|uniref:hypothetical protein n=1 Tax=Sporosarcina saromensis TaxID=359365 RepID=UPI00295F078E|nr:hypothetical protein [Sporosarcina saromensis]
MNKLAKCRMEQGAVSEEFSKKYTKIALYRGGLSVVGMLVALHALDKLRGNFR